MMRTMRIGGDEVQQILIAEVALTISRNHSQVR
jgi:hypothetical protein